VSRGQTDSKESEKRKFGKRNYLTLMLDSRYIDMWMDRACKHQPSCKFEVAKQNYGEKKTTK